MTDDLAAFLRARLDEDEAVALATIGINHRARMRNGIPPPRWVGAEDSSDIRSEDGILRVKHTWVRERDHIIRHDPARVLREVEAKRAIVREYEAVTEALAGDEGDRVLYATIRSAVTALAAAYSDHPDYREDWKP